MKKPPINGGLTLVSFVSGIDLLNQNRWRIIACQAFDAFFDIVKFIFKLGIGTGYLDRDALFFQSIDDDRD